MELQHINRASHDQEGVHGWCYRLQRPQASCAQPDLRQSQRSSPLTSAYHLAAGGVHQHRVGELHD